MLDHECRSGEIGRRSGLKIHRALARAGSIPAFGTNNKETMAVFAKHYAIFDDKYIDTSDWFMGYPFCHINPDNQFNDRCIFASCPTTLTLMWRNK